MSKHMISKGIDIWIMAPYAHAQNGKIEHYICTIEDGIQTCLADSKPPLSFWGDAALTFVYVHNRLSTSMLPDNMMPHEVMNHSKPDLSHICIWGCQCFPIIPLELCTKGGPRWFEAIFVGYEENWIGWQVCDLQGKYLFSCDVVFNASVPGNLSPHCGIPIDFASLPPPSIASEANSNSILPLAPNQQPSTSYTPLHLPTLSDTICDHDVIINTCTQCTTQTDTGPLPKTKHQYNDIHTITSFISINNIPPHDHSLHSFEHTSYHNLFNLCFISSQLPSFLHHITDLLKPPNTYHEALSRPDKDVWISTMKREHDSLEECKAFQHTFLPDSWKFIGLMTSNITHIDQLLLERRKLILLHKVSVNDQRTMEKHMPQSLYLQAYGSYLHLPTCLTTKSWVST